MDPKYCFICNCVCVNYNKNLFKIKSKYSATRFSDLAVKFLGNFPFKRKYSAECDENQVCNDCLNKVNEYDLARLTAKRVKNELHELLVATELSFCDETEAPNEPIHRLFTESTETDELANNIQIEESTSSDYETGKVLNKEAKDEIGVKDDEPASHPFKRYKKVSVGMRDEQEYACFPNKYQKTEIVQTREESAKSNCRTCVKCYLSFNTKPLYEQHMRDHKEGEDQFKCPYCALDLLGDAALADHRELHENASSPFQCVLCASVKMFKTKGALVRHMRIHSGLKFYQCERCGKEFIHKSSFHMHILAHDDIRKKECPTCSRMFRSTSHLNRHLRIHSGIKPFACEICNQKFAQRYNMTVHRRLHDSNSEKGRTEKNHLCNFCGSSFARKSKLHEHLQKSHEAVKPHTSIGNNLTEKRSQTIN